MSESVNSGRSGSRFHLLTSVSSITLLATMLGAGLANAGESALWIELSAHSEQVVGANQFALPFDGVIPAVGPTGPVAGILNLGSSDGGDGKLTFRPDDADWVFSAFVSYGRSHGKGKINQMKALPTTAFATYHTSLVGLSFPINSTNLKAAKLLADSITGDTVSSETHSILDFSAGKDVGLGMFGHGSTSVFSVGARFANFTSRFEASGVEGALGNEFKKAYQTAFYTSTPLTWFHTKESETWRTISGSARISHEFKGVGPSIYWDASVPLSGDEKRGSVVTLDWGVNAAILFGKQKSKEQHESASAYNCYGPICNAQQVQYAPHDGHASRIRNVTVPNLGGFIGASYRIGDFKASFGYRADFFFGAMNAGIGAGTKSNTGFSGPFASVGVGIGD